MSKYDILVTIPFSLDTKPSLNLSFISYFTIGINNLVSSVLHDRVNCTVIIFVLETFKLSNLCN